MRRLIWLYIIAINVAFMHQVMQAKRGDSLEHIVNRKVQEELARRRRHNAQGMQLKSRVEHDVHASIDARRAHLREKGHHRVKRPAHHKKVRRVNDSKEYDYVYKIPSWPFRSIFYVEHDLVQASVEAEFANKAYSSRGRTKDISKLVFTENTIKLQDIFLASKLIRDGKLDSNAASPNNPQSHYFYILANQELNFHATTDIERVNVSYTRHFFDDQLSLGFRLPIVRRNNKISLESDISSATRSTLQASAPNFFNKYANLEAFVEAILDNRDSSISYNKDDSESGIGDFEIFSNVEMRTKHLERAVAGVSVILPTANETLVDRLWYPQLGNGGFLELAAFGGFLKSVNQLFNPHAYAEVGLSISAHVRRRVPTKRTYNGTSPSIGSNVEKDLTLGGDDVQFKTAYDEFDVKYRGFANDIKTVRINPGPRFNLMVGNVFEHVFSERFFIDVFYDGFFRGADYVGHTDDSNVNYSVITDNTYQIRHKVGGRFAYFFDVRKQIFGGVSLPIGGRNTLKSIDAYASFNLQF